MKRDCSITAVTPGGIYDIFKELWGSGRNLFGHALCDLLALDEASQMNLPEALTVA